MIKKILQWFDDLAMYVVVDGSDNSISLSKRLVKDMGLMKMNTQPKAIVFRIPEKDSYGFMIDPTVEQETQLNEVQYNDKYRTIGFESLCPTVNRILYDYQLPQGRFKLAVKKHRTIEHKVFYEISKSLWRV